MALHSRGMTVPFERHLSLLPCTSSILTMFLEGRENTRTQKLRLPFSFSIFCNIVVTQSQLTHSFQVRITRVTGSQQEHPDRGSQGNQYALNCNSERCHYTTANAK